MDYRSQITSRAEISKLVLTADELEDLNLQVNTDIKNGVDKSDALDRVYFQLKRAHRYEHWTENQVLDFLNWLRPRDLGSMTNEQILDEYYRRKL
jgi:hypothetical protein